MNRNFTQCHYISQIAKIHGNDRTEPIYCNADRMFPGYPYVQTVAYLQCKYSTSSLMKNDLNGHFLTDQPGQPFNRDIPEHAGMAVLPICHRDSCFTGNLPILYEDTSRGHLAYRNSEYIPEYPIFDEGGVKGSILLVIQTYSYLILSGVIDFRLSQQGKKEVLK
jgi:hypothetical protein